MYLEIWRILDLRIFLGPDIGYINNTKQWQKTTPQSFSSPFYCQADIGNYSA